MIILDILSFAALFWLVFFLSVLCHELGHLLIGYLVGSSPTEFSIGAWVLLRISTENFAFQIGLIPDRGYVRHGTLCLLKPWQLVLLYSGGSLANLGTAVFGWIVYQTGDFYPGFFLGLSVVSLGGLVFTLYPSEDEDSISDGKRILDVFRRSY